MDERRDRVRDGGVAPPSLTRFVEAQHARVVGTLALYTGDAALAADLTQETFVRVCQRWEQVEAMAAPGAWVHRVAMNLATSALRRNGAEARAWARDVQRRVGVAADDAEVDRRVDVRRAVAELDLPERAVIVLRFFADLSVADTAAVLGIPEGTVKTRTRRAVEQLRSSGIEAKVTIDG